MTEHCFENEDKFRLIALDLTQKLRKSSGLLVLVMRCWLICVHPFYTLWKNRKISDRNQALKNLVKLLVHIFDNLLNSRRLYMQEHSITQTVRNLAQNNVV